MIFILSQLIVGVSVIYRLLMFVTLTRDDRQSFIFEFFWRTSWIEGEPTIIEIANSWFILNTGGGPTDDKPIVTLHTPQNPNEVSNFMNIRVADIRSCY